MAGRWKPARGGRLGIATAVLQKQTFIPGHFLSGTEIQSRAGFYGRELCTQESFPLTSFFLFASHSVLGSFVVLLLVSLALPFVEPHRWEDN